MTDKISFSEQPAGQPVEPSKGGDAQGTPATGSSDNEIRRLIATEVEAALRKAQSLTDKAEARVMEKIAQTGKASGEAAPQQGQASGEQPAAQAKADQAGEAVQPSKEGAPTSKASEGESITQNAWKIMEQMGVEITTEDPEAQTLDRSSPGAFYVSLVGAIQAKKSRTNAPPPTATTPMGTGSPAPVDNSKIDPIELFSRAYKKKS